LFLGLPNNSYFQQQGSKTVAQSNPFANYLNRKSILGSLRILGTENGKQKLTSDVINN